MFNDKNHLSLRAYKYDKNKGVKTQDCYVAQSESYKKVSNSGHRGNKSH